MVNLAADSWTKYCNFNKKRRKNLCPKKVVFIFCRNFAGDFFRRRRIFADFETEFWKVSRSQAYLPISRWCYGEHFLRKFIRKPQFCSERWSSRAQSIVLFSFAAKSTLRIKIQYVDFFFGGTWMLLLLKYQNKLIKFILVFDL